MKNYRQNFFSFWKNNKKVIGFIFLVFFVWQVIITALSLIHPSFLPIKKTFMYQGVDDDLKFLWNRANFDGVHYLHIARFGYGLRQQAFFPAYPQLIRKVTPLFGGNDLLAAVFISNISLLLGLFFLYKIVCLDCGEEVARWAIFLLLLFPTSFFFGGVYTESLFLMLVVASFYAARRRCWWLAGLLGGLASYTQLVGIFLLPALVWEWWSWQDKKSLKNKFLSLIPLSLTPVGLLVYMNFLWEKYQDPLLFFHVQPYFGAERSGGKIILLYQVFWRYFKMALTTKLDFLYFTVWLEILVAISFLILLYLAFRKKIRTSYLIFGIISYLIPTLTGTFSSMPRYVLALFPCFIYLGAIKNKLLYYSLALIFSFLLILCSIFFYQGYWIA